MTTDALNCQRGIAQQIKDQGGDYVLALKRNQGTLHDDVRRFLDDPQSKVGTAKPTVDADHGRIETRTATLSTDIDWLQQDHQWPSLIAIGKVVRIRETTDKTTTETAYYLLSAPLSPERFNEVVRSHWDVENRLHWRVDVVMNEDQDRTRLGHAPNNLAVLRHMAINVMQEGYRKRIPARQVQAGRLGQRLPRSTPGPILKCDYPGLNLLNNFGCGGAIYCLQPGLHGEQFERSTLADDALVRGREDQAAELIAEAFAACDRRHSGALAEAA